MLAFVIIVSIVVFIYFMKIYGDICYDKGKRDKHKECVRQLLGEAQYNSLSHDCYPPDKIERRGRMVMKIKVVECGRKEYEWEFVEEK